MTSVRPVSKISVASWETKANAIIATGMKYIGTPYKFGAKPGQTRTFDCSSYTQYVYEVNGIVLPRVSRQQSRVGVQVSLSNIRKGDLLFFTTRARRNLSGIQKNWSRWLLHWKQSVSKLFLPSWCND